MQHFKSIKLQALLNDKSDRKGKKEQNKTQHAQGTEIKCYIRLKNSKPGKYEGKISVKP